MFLINKHNASVIINTDNVTDIGKYGSGGNSRIVFYLSTASEYSKSEWSFDDTGERDAAWEALLSALGSMEI